MALRPRLFKGVFTGTFTGTFTGARGMLGTRHIRYASERATDHVRLVEVGPRDGLQNEKKSIPKETKLELISRLAKTGVTTIEAGSFVPAKWVPQVSLFIYY